MVADDTRRDRIELAGLGFHWPNASLTHGLENTLGYNPVRLALYSAATGAEDHVGLPDQRKFSPLFPSYRSPLANLLGLRFIATGAPIETIDKQPEAGRPAARGPHQRRLHLREPRRLPARAVRDRGAGPPTSRACSPTACGPHADLRTTVLLEHRRRPAPRPRRPGRVRIASYRNTEVVLEADSPDGGWVVLNDVWHPWWFADVDGKPAEIAARQRPLPRRRRAAGAARRPLPVPPRSPAPGPSSGSRKARNSLRSIGGWARLPRRCAVGGSMAVRTSPTSGKVPRHRAKRSSALL